MKSPKGNQGSCGFVFGFCNSNQVHEVIAEFQWEFVMRTRSDSFKDYKISESPAWTFVGIQKECMTPSLFWRNLVCLGRPDLHQGGKTQLHSAKKEMTHSK